MILKPWLNYKTNRAQKNNKGLRESVAYKAAERIGIIFCNDEQSKIEDADKLISLLKKDDKKDKARFIVTGSAAFPNVMPRFAAYSASKYGAAGLTKELAQEYKKENICS